MFILGFPYVLNGGRFFFFYLKRTLISRIMVAPVSPAALIISTTMPDGPAALPDFIFELAFFTMSIVIGIGLVNKELACACHGDVRIRHGRVQIDGCLFVGIISVVDITGLVGVNVGVDVCEAGVIVF